MGLNKQHHQEFLFLIFLYYLNFQQHMDAIICTKLKDGLYVGNKKAASSLQFLVANKFYHIINCTLQLKNYFEDLDEIRYYKLKYDRTKSQQQLWGQSMKKMFRIIQFINISEQKGESCLIHSNLGDNRCFAVAIIYLMNRYSWELNKTLEFVNSKKTICKVSLNFLLQLRNLQEELRSYRHLTSKWDEIGYQNEDQILLVNTYINTKKIQYQQKKIQKQTEKKVQWKDKILKKSKDKKNLKSEEKNKTKSNLSQSKDSILIKKDCFKKCKLRKSPNQFQICNKSINSNPTHSQSLSSLLKGHSKSSQLKSQLTKRFTNGYEDQQDENASVCIGRSSNDNQPKVYNIIVNNFINPNISVSSSKLRNSPIESFSQNKVNSGKRFKQSSWQNIKQQKINSTFFGGDRQDRQDVTLSDRLVESVVNLTDCVDKKSRKPIQKRSSIQRRSRPITKERLRRNQIKNSEFLQVSLNK